MRRHSINKLELRRMGFSYPGGEKVFSEFSVSFNQGEALFLQGPRGAGKNTLAKILLGLQAPTEGEYRINDTVVNYFSYSEFDPYRLNMGHSYDVGGLINNQTLFENFQLLLDYHDYMETQLRRDYVISVMERFEVQAYKNFRPAHVTSTVRKAATVLRAFLLRPELIILDNPTQGMDVEQVPLLIELINEHKREHGLKYIIISSDDPFLMDALKGHSLSMNSAVPDETIRKAG